MFLAAQHGRLIRSRLCARNAPGRANCHGYVPASAGVRELSKLRAHGSNSRNSVTSHRQVMGGIMIRIGNSSSNWIRFAACGSLLIVSAAFAASSAITMNTQYDVIQELEVRRESQSKTFPVDNCDDVGPFTWSETVSLALRREAHWDYGGERRIGGSVSLMGISVDMNQAMRDQYGGTVGREITKSHTWSAVVKENKKAEITVRWHLVVRQGVIVIDSERIYYTFPDSYEFERANVVQLPCRETPTGPSVGNEVRRDAERRAVRWFGAWSRADTGAMSSMCEVPFWFGNRMFASKDALHEVLDTASQRMRTHQRVQSIMQSHVKSIQELTIEGRAGNIVSMLSLQDHDIIVQLELSEDGVAASVMSFIFRNSDGRLELIGVTGS